MNIAKSVLPFLSIFNLDTGRETAVETRPAPPEWLPAGGDIIPAPGQKIERIIKRVKQDGNVTIYEQEIIFIHDPDPAPQTQPQPQPQEDTPVFYTVLGPPGAEPWELAMVQKWREGKARWAGGNWHPETVGTFIRGAR